MDCSCYRSSCCITRKRKLLSYQTCSECEEIESWRHIIDAECPHDEIESWRHIIDAEMSPHDDQDMAAGDDQEMAEDMVLDDKKETTKAAEDANEAFMAWHPEDAKEAWYPEDANEAWYPEKDANEAYLEDANDIAWCRFDESKKPPEPDEEPEPEEVQEQWPEDATDDEAGDQEHMKEDDEEQSLGDDSSEVEEKDA